MEDIQNMQMQDMQKEDYISTGISDGIIKLCPFCGIPSELINGCNYVTCICKRGLNEKSEWCWLCGLPKYQPNPQNNLGCCNEREHNSH